MTSRLKQAHNTRGRRKQELKAAQPFLTERFVKLVCSPQAFAAKAHCACVDDFHISPRFTAAVLSQRREPPVSAADRQFMPASSPLRCKALQASAAVLSTVIVLEAGHLIVCLLQKVTTSRADVVACHAIATGCKPQATPAAPTTWHRCFLEGVRSAPQPTQDLHQKPDIVSSWSRRG